MPLFIIPVDNQNPDFTFYTNLEDSTYFFRMRWNTRAGKWFMDILNDQNEAIVQSVAIVQGIDYFELVQEKVPVGKLFFSNLPDPTADCGRNDLGENFEMFFNGAV